MFGLSQTYLDIVTYNNVNYGLIKTRKTAQVFGSPNASGRIVIPRSVNYGGLSYGVDKVDENALRRGQITEVVFPSSLKSIVAYAFADTDLTNVDFPVGLKLGEGTFINCQLIEIYPRRNNLHTIKSFEKQSD